MDVHASQCGLDSNKGTKCDAEICEKSALVGGFESAVSESVGLAGISVAFAFLRTIALNHLDGRCPEFRWRLGDGSLTRFD